ncbi:MAG: ATP-dependent RecD-like DNA helicase [Myxococcota bacterium]
MMAGDEQISGELLGFTFRADDRAFAVAKIRAANNSEFIAVGPLGHVTEGQHVSLTGRWMHHDTFGRQFKVRGFLVEDPRTIRGLQLYLSSGAVPGLGKTIAKRIVEAFGLETLKILNESPGRLREVEGIGPKRLKRILSQWTKDTVGREVHATLRGYGIGDALSRRIIEHYGEDAMKVITEHPYRMTAEVRGVGFRTADLIARERGLAIDSPERAQAALIHVLREAASSEGHCYLPRGELVERARRLQVPADAAGSAVDVVATAGLAVIQNEERVLLPWLANAEDRISRRLKRLERSAPPPVIIDPGPIEVSLSMTLSIGQRAAVELALQSGVSIITGGPGTGKTTIVRVLLAAANANQEQWLLAAPTGRAARRLAEATGQEAKTIHRLLEYNGRSHRFDRDFANPLDADGVLIDEASMIDVSLMDDLLAAIPPACRLVLVGDADQLPSVGPGRVLADIIDSERVAVARLSEVYRQAAHSGIVLNAHRINRGEIPLSGQQEIPPREDFYRVHREDPREARAALLQIVSARLPRLGFDPKVDVQVLTPMHNGPLGTTALNVALQGLLNPGSPAFKRGDRELRVGDRVIQVKNDYDHDIFNGDVGRVLAVSTRGVEVEFEGQRVSLSADKTNDLQLAYAISVHKSQGSEYPAVILVLHRAHRMMLRRNLLYTAVTRAKRFCCLIDTPWAVSRAVSQAGGVRRYTHLKALLQER